MDIGEVKVASSVKETQPQCIQRKPSKVNTNSVQTCVIRISKYQIPSQKKTHTLTTDTLNFNFDSCLSFFSISSFRIWFALVRCEKPEINLRVYALCKGWDAQKQFHWIYISVYQRMTKGMLER